jgi:thiamine-monophosphate kinase
MINSRPEFEFINDLLAKAGSLAKGAGDDAFVFGKYLISADMSVEGTHFRLDWSTPSQAIEKCLLSNFSDINAMGGSSCAILFSVCMNKKWSKKIRDEIAETAVKVCKKYNVRILGGDTTGGDLGIFSVTVFGKTKGKILLRNAAKAGDDVWLAGLPSGSNIGSITANPPLCLGKELAKIKGIGACIDTSDSIAESLQHISGQSKVRLEIEKMEDAFLQSAEDFCLLFTARKSARESILKLAGKFSKKIPISKIGNAKKGNGIFLGGKAIEVKGWQHF